MEYYAKGTAFGVGYFHVAFDPAASFHTYSIDYSATNFSVYGDGQFIAQVVANATVSVPSLPVYPWFYITASTSATSGISGTQLVAWASFSMSKHFTLLFCPLFFLSYLFFLLLLLLLLLASVPPPTCPAVSSASCTHRHSFWALTTLVLSFF